MQQLERGYDLQEQSKKNQKTGVLRQDDFHLKKELDKVGKLIQSVIEKLERLINEPSKYNVNKKRLEKLQKLYNKIIHIKGSTNLSKLKEIGELALIKV